MPKMGESLQEGTITKWLKKVGDKVERDEMILEISTDKVDTEVPSPASGVIINLFAQENEIVEVGKVIAQIETEAENINNIKKSLETPLAQPIQEILSVDKEVLKESNKQSTYAEIYDVVMPKMGESLQEGTITKWLKKVGDKIERDEMLLEISTDKVDTEVPAPVSGILIEILYDANQTVEVGKTIARISSSKDVQIVPEQKTEKSLTKSEEIKQDTTEMKSKEEYLTKTVTKFLSPLVKSIIKEENISDNELANIKGTGSDGRITKQDIIEYIEKRKLMEERVPEITTETPSVQIKYEKAIKQESMLPNDDFEVIPMDRIRLLIAEHMVYSKQTSPHVTSVGEADVTNIVKFRNNFQNEFQKREGYKLTFTPFFAKATTDALKAYPMVNVKVEDKNIIRYKRIHLGFATALNDGNLIVPVIKNADALNLSGFARAIYDLSTRARNKKLNPDDIQGATFSITNVGTFGTLFGTPIINQPNTGIMGIGAIQKRPVVRQFNDEYIIVIRDMVYVSITYDHRVIDGMLAGQWLAKMIQSLEEMDEDYLKTQF